MLQVAKTLAPDIEWQQGVAARILREAEEVLKPYVASDGKAVFATSAHVISGASAV